MRTWIIAAAPIAGHNVDTTLTVAEPNHDGICNDAPDTGFKEAQ